VLEVKQQTIDQSLRSFFRQTGNLIGSILYPIWYLHTFLINLTLFFFKIIEPHRWWNG